ncbi:FAD binding domain-containing protein [Aquisalimonas asiatica]|uniref:Carbon monoxide dehydrogenase, medium subunit n=1 Tax=Aquisalimonas asiatica TaxID=406100 RepID=A0A1H8S1X2_9GAMM|nr:xanthine dehydrogenase family protein subunit M [Aquisalimonas asiatica]SEO72434.1 carbon monoxide dehydrogenase, medium subunit [Aquisalimonas asiatica]
MIPGNFEYHSASGVDEAVALLARHGDSGKLLAGGHSLLPMMKLRFAEPAHLIDLNGIAELRGISEEGDLLVIGSMTSENALIDSAILQQRCPVLPEVARLIADPQVRNRGTIGGDALHGDPGNDHPAVLMALEAEFVIRSAAGERREPANGFYLGPYLTALRDDDLVTAIRVPVPAADHGWAYAKFKRKTGDYATAATCCLLEMEGDTCRRARITLTNVGPTPLRAEDAEEVLVGHTVDAAAIERAAQAAMSICEPAADLRGSPEYKTHMAGEMTRRAITTALRRTRGE